MSGVTGVDASSVTNPSESNISTVTNNDTRRRRSSLTDDIEIQNRIAKQNDSREDAEKSYRLAYPPSQLDLPEKVAGVILDIIG